MRHLRWQRLVVFSIALLTACSDSTGPGPVVGAVVITAPQTALAVGARVQLVATLLNESGVLIQSGQVSWSSSEQGVATVSPGGLVTAVAAGTTSINATSGGKSGSIEIRVLPPDCTGPTHGAIAPGETRSGALTPADCILRSFDVPARGWRLDLAAQTSVRIELSSPDLNPAIILTDLQLNVLDVMVGGGSSVILRRSLPAGAFIVWAVGVPRSPTEPAYGSFQLAVQLGPPPCTAGDRPPIMLDQTRSGTIGEGDCTFIHGGPAQGWRLDLAAATRVEIRMASTQFAPAVVVTDMNLMVLDAGFDMGSGSARLVISLPAGSFVLWAVSLDDRTGDFQLSVNPAQPLTCPIAPSPITLGQTVSGTLAPGDCILDDGSFADRWTFTLAQPTTVQIDMMSNAFDTFLGLTDAAGNVIAEDDDGGEGLNSRIVRQLSPGEYTIWTSSFHPGATGPYQLSLQAVQGITSSTAVGAGGLGGMRSKP
jgi:hypothetical protein